MALIPLVLIMLGSIEKRIGAAPAQNQEAGEAANEGIVVQGGIVVEGGITQGQVLRFNVARSTIVPGPHVTNAHPGGVNLELRVFDSQGNLLVTYAFPNQNQNQNGGVWISFFDLGAAQLPASAFDNTGRAQLTGLVKSIDPNNPNRPPDPSCGFVASGEIFNIGDVNRQTLVHIAGKPISACNGR
jgi:hypothetical protein